MNCPNCEKELSRRRADCHVECECGSIVILPHGERYSLCGTLKRIAQRHGVAFDGADSIGGGVAIAEAIEGVGDAVKALGAVFKSGGNGGGGIWRGGHAAKQVMKRGGAN